MKVQGSLASDQKSVRASERGASLIEYVLLLALIALVCVSALTYFGGNAQTGVKHSSSCIVTAGDATPVCP